MTFNVVENVGGRPRVSWPGAAVLFLGLVAAAAAVPAAGFWLAFHDITLVGSAVAVGFSMACCSWPLLLVQQSRLPLDRLPTHAAPGSAAAGGER